MRSQISRTKEVPYEIQGDYKKQDKQGCSRTNQGNSRTNQGTPGLTKGNLKSYFEQQSI